MVTTKNSHVKATSKSVFNKQKFPKMQMSSTNIFYVRSLMHLKLTVIFFKKAQ